MRNILYNLRKESNYTQSDVANKIGCSRESYTKMEQKNMKNISTKSIQLLAKLYNVSTDYLINNGENRSKGVKIPVLGSIPAGIPVEAVEDIIDFEEISSEMAMTGEYFGLQVKGDSMTPRILNKDVVIVRKQSNAETGDVCVVMVNGFEATLKQIKIDESGITLIPFNTIYKPVHYNKDDIDTMPIKIVGKVVELRGKF